jgi:hypothetical protein
MACFRGERAEDHDKIGGRKQCFEIDQLDSKLNGSGRIDIRIVGDRLKVERRG